MEVEGKKEMSLSFINCLLFIRGVSCSRLTVNAITRFHLRVRLLVQIHLWKEHLISEGRPKVESENRLNNSSRSREHLVRRVTDTRLLALMK